MIGVPLLFALIAVEPATASPSLADVVDMSITVEKRLRLIAWDLGDGDTDLGLEGALHITVTNRSTLSVAVRDLGVHGLRWSNTVTGETFQMVHPCECANMLEPVGIEVGRVHVMKPGQSRVIELTDFGCSGTWTPPPPGTWTLSYRMLPAADTVTSKRSGRVDFPHLEADCRALLLDDAIWIHAVTSEPIIVTLGKPKRRR